VTAVSNDLRPGGGESPGGVGPDLTEADDPDRLALDADGALRWRLTVDNAAPHLGQFLEGATQTQLREEDDVVGDRGRVEAVIGGDQDAVLGQCWQIQPVGPGATLVHELKVRERFDRRAIKLESVDPAHTDHLGATGLLHERGSGGRPGVEDPDVVARPPIRHRRVEAAVEDRDQHRSHVRDSDFLVDLHTVPAAFHHVEPAGNVQLNARRSPEPSLLLRVRRLLAQLGRHGVGGEILQRPR
jgi:hypothetical protein